MADNYPTYTRPSFDSICLTGLPKDKLQDGLKIAVKEYSAHLTRVMKAQVQWLAEARDHEQAAGLPPRDFGGLETGPCMTKTPMFGYRESIELERIPADPALLYVFLPTEQVQACVENRNFEAVSAKYFPGVVLAFDLCPYDPWISSKSVSSTYHKRRCNRVEREELQSFLAIFPTDRFTAGGDGVWTRCITRGHFDIVAHGEMIWGGPPSTDWPSASGWV
ncbi:RolB family protein [Sinorhizobium meliloti]|uniref:RolB family protein n=1 Tax=Rhizobium meliloti TaxID=382 RepID=UPI001E4A0EFA|nr:RolB family protein [Sinorhizobium meliloti]UFX13037.1 RolB family protein [Sinorhizobium meliloti]